MRKGVILTKRMVALFLVLLLSIESFGAVVSDNDGSAFITKAEFDSLKINFQSQIDQYNTSIDSKIDGAIASYLAGIKIDTQTKLNMPTSILEFPLKLYVSSPFNYDKHYGEGSYNYATGVAQWTPVYNMYNTGDRRWYIGSFTATDANKVQAWDTFLDYDTVIEDTDGSKAAVIKRKLVDYKATYNCRNWFMKFIQNGGGMGSFRSYLVCGVTSAMVRTQGDEAFNTGRTYSLEPSGTYFGTAAKNGSSLTFRYALTYSTSDSTRSLVNSSATQRKWSVNTSGWQIATAEFGAEPTWTVEYETENLNAIYNYKDYFVPVSENGAVKLTNYHTAFTNLYTGDVTFYDSSAASATTVGLTWTCYGYDSPNYTIADVNHCSKTDQFDTAFINSGNLLYEVKDTVSGDKFNQYMINGIYLGTMEKEGKFRVELNLKYTGLVKPIVMFRKEDFWDTWNMDNPKNIKIKYNNLEDQTYAELENNKLTKIEFEVKKGDKIWVKILNPTDVDVTMDEPLLTFIGQ